MAEKKNNKKRLFLTIAVCALLVIVFILLNTYAFWRLKGEQSDSNYVVGACLSFEFVEEEDINNNPIGGFDLTNTWPMTDEEGIATTGYTFKVKNNCAEDVNYQVVLESLKTTNENYFDNEYIKLQLDNGAINRYSALDGVDKDPDDAHPENIRETKEVYAGVIPGTDKDTENVTKSEITHNIKIWVASDAENDQIGKEFRSRIKVFAGQGIDNPSVALTPESCFEFDPDTGKITDYYYANEECGLEALVIPATIDGVIVKEIAFKDTSYDSDAKNQAYGYVDLSRATGLETIGNGCFRNYVGSGKELIIPNSVTTIGDTAFYRYDGKKLVLGDNVSYIGYYSFLNYHGSDQPLTIPGNNTEIGVSAFNFYNGPLLTLEDGVKTIGDTAFNGYIGTGKDLYIPDSVTTFSGLASFNGNKIHLSRNANIVGGFASYVGAGQDLTIPASYSGYGSYSFYRYTGENAQLTIEEGVQAIGRGLFQSYVGNDIVLPSTIVKVYTDAFKDFTGKITFNMTPAQYANVTKENNWKNESATVVCLENNTEVPCE